MDSPAEKAAVGYSARLARALFEGPQPMSVRKLADALQEKSGLDRGTSYGGVRQYVEDKVRNPRVELLRAMADVLKVRPEWLAFDDGEMTDELERARQAASISYPKYGTAELDGLVYSVFDRGIVARHEAGILVPETNPSVIALLSP